MAGLESATYINQLNPLNPSDTLDYVATGDDHIRLVKSTIQNTFTRITGPVSASDADLTNVTYLADTGTLNTLVVTFSPAWTSYVAGKGVLIKVLNTNTGAATLNVNGLGAQAIVGSGGQALVGGELVAGSVYHLVYSTAGFRLLSESGYTRKTAMYINPYSGTAAYVVNSANGALALQTNGHNNVVCNADGTTTFAAGISGTTGTFSGALTVNGVANQGFASGTRIAFWQAAAPTGWTQITTNTDCMLRVVSTAGGGAGGTDSPTTMTSATMPSHTHTFTTGTESANHTHTDAGHTHTYSFPAAAPWAYMPNVNNNSGGATATTSGSGHANLGTQSANHTHSGTTAATGSTNWTPKYVDMIICNKT